VLKKILSVLLGDKNGRKFLGYVVGIALFIVLIPLIATLGLFGWMAGDGYQSMINYDTIYNSMPESYRETIEAYSDELNLIAVTFEESGFSDDDISKAKTIFISCLTGKETEENFYQRYANCFLTQSEEVSLFNNISTEFGVTFTDEEIAEFNKLYGET